MKRGKTSIATKSPREGSAGPDPGGLDLERAQEAIDVVHHPGLGRAGVLVRRYQPGACRPDDRIFLFGKEQRHGEPNRSMTRVSGNEARFDALAVRVFADAGELGRGAAEDAATVIAGAVARAGEASVMLATGNSQLAFLAALTTHEGVPWGQARIFHMDEYVGLPPDHPASFARYIRTRLSDRVGSMEVNYFRQTASLGAAREEAERYAALLARHPVDLCVMGIGENGHLAFNDPGVADFADPLDVKVVPLDQACRRQQVGEGHFPTLADVPAHAITVTIPALLRAADVIVVCPEARKASAVGQALLGPVSPTCPASILRRQPHARLYLDAESAKGLPPL